MMRILLYPKDVYAVVSNWMYVFGPKIDEWIDQWMYVFDEDEGDNDYTTN